MTELYETFNQYLYKATSESGLVENPDDTQSPSLSTSIDLDPSGSYSSSGRIVGNLEIGGGYLQSENYVSSTSGWRLSPDTAEFNVSTILTSLDIPDTTTANSFHVESDGDTFWGANNADFTSDNDNANAFVLKTGVAKFQSITLSGSVAISGIANDVNTDISILTASHDLVFSSTDADTVSWASGTITLSNGRTFSIDAGNTGNMVARTLIYLDPGTSSTVLQTTTSPSTAVGANKMLIALAEDAASSATFQVTDGIGGLGVDESQVFVANLAAINADLGSITAGNITLDSSGYIKGGQSGYDTGTGFFLGYDTSAYKFSIGVGGSSTASLTWDGTDLTVNGYVASSIGAFGGDGSDGALSISSGTTTINASSARVVVKNYTSVSITGTASLTISNPHTNGTILIIKSQGAVTMTSSGTAIDMAGMGAGGGTAGTGNTGGGNNGTSGGAGSDGTTLTPIDETAAAGNLGVKATAGTGGTGGSASTAYAGDYSTTEYKLHNKIVAIACGSGGGGGGGGYTSISSAGGDGAVGGRGGGAILIECAGAFNFTTGTIDVSGVDGSDAPDESNGDEASAGGGGGGGSAGMVFILYNTLTADSGTYTLDNGAGGDGGDADGAAGLGMATGGGGGGGASLGGAGGAGATGIDDGAAGGAANGVAGSAGTKAGGGGGSGAYSSTTAATGGAGGAAGAAVTTEHKLVASNSYFA